MRSLAAAALLIVAVMVAACSGGTASQAPGPTLNLGTPAATPARSGGASAGASAVASGTPAASAAPSATSAPTAAPTRSAPPTTAPTPTPAPTAAALRTDPEAAFGVLLEAAQLPAGSEAGDTTRSEEYEFEAFNDNNGIRVVSQAWSGQAFSSLFHFVFQFPSEADAEAFLRDGGATLSEAEVGLEEGDAGFLFESILDDVQYFHGEVDAFGVKTQNYNYLMRLKNFVVKVFVGGGEVAESVAEEIAFFAAQNVNTINVPRSPTATPAPTVAPTPEPSASASSSAGAEDFPNAAEAALLDHIPTDTRGTCGPADPFYRLEIDSVTCAPQEGLNVDYSSFESVDDVRAGFDFDYERAEPTPTEDGECSEGTLLSTYTIDEGDVAGQIMCTTFTSDGRTFRVIEWTNEPLRILGYMQSATLEWDELIEFWSTKAGPIE
jgi:hypothetical protein